MPRPNEACSNCFFAIQTKLGLSCNWDTPKTDVSTVLLWPIVQPNDWCGAYSNTGQAVYRTENVPPVFVWDAAITFAGYGTMYSRFNNSFTLSARFAPSGSLRATAIKLP